MHEWHNAVCSHFVKITTHFWWKITSDFLLTFIDDNILIEYIPLGIKISGNRVNFSIKDDPNELNICFAYLEEKCKAVVKKWYLLYLKWGKNVTIHTDETPVTTTHFIF